MIGETGAVLLGLLLMEINIIKIKGAEKVCKSLPTYCHYFGKTQRSIFPRSLIRASRSLFPISIIRDCILINTDTKARVQITAFTETCN